MKRTTPPLASAFVALPLTLLLATPALAQEVQTQPVPPPAPVVQSAPAAPADAVPAPAPEVATVPAAPAAPAPVFAPQSPVVQQLPSVTPPAASTASADAADTTVPAPRRAAPRATTPARATPLRAATAAPAAIAAPPITPPPAATRPAAATPPAVTAAPTVPDTNQAQTTTTTSQTAIWPWIVGAIAILGAILAAVMMRRRSRDQAVAYESEALTTDQPMVAPVAATPVAAAPVFAAEPQYRDPSQITAPVEAVAMAAPTPAEHTEIHDADQADVDALTGSAPAIVDRPWIEFAMRPVRAGANVDEAMVEIELTVGNAGAVAAENVRIATFMFPSEPADADAFERMLLEHGEEGMSDLVSIAAGEGTRVDATLAVPRDRVADLFNPVVVADARYRLPDGSEGRTLASFEIGRTGADGDFGPLANERAMHEDVEARLYAMAEHV